MTISRLKDCTSVVRGRSESPAGRGKDGPQSARNFPRAWQHEIHHASLLSKIQNRQMCAGPFRTCPLGTFGPSRDHHSSQAHNQSDSHRFQPNSASLSYLPNRFGSEGLSPEQLVSSYYLDLFVVAAMAKILVSKAHILREPSVRNPWAA